MKAASAVNPLAMRGAAAAAIAILITTVLSLQRPYWVIMIAVVLVNQTTGQSLRRSGERVAATLAGFAIGWGLEWITSPHHWVQIGIMMAAVFLAVFFRQSWGRGSYAWMMLFISLYVVFLFAVLGEWSPAIFAERIADTCLGAGAALLATFAVHSPGSRDRLRQEADKLWDQCRAQLAEAVAGFTCGAPPTGQPHAALLQQLEALRSHMEEALYETFLMPAARRDAVRNFAVAEMLCYLALGLFDAIACGAGSSQGSKLRVPLEESIGPVVHARRTDFELPPGVNPLLPLPACPEACRFAAEECRKAGLDGSDLIWARPLLYYAAAFSDALRKPVCEPRV